MTPTETPLAQTAAPQRGATGLPLWCVALVSAALLSACAVPGTNRAPLACDDGLKAAFRPDTHTRVVAVRPIKRGEALVAVDSPAPITAAGDMCLVKLLVGPGLTSEPPTAPSYTEGIGIEVWLPDPARWNDRIRNYGGGGWVGGGHRLADQIGSKVPALVNANMGYAVGTTDAGQPHSQDGSFILKADGTVNSVVLRDFSARAMVEQAVKTEALTRLYYGHAPRFRYFDGHSQGGRQGLKVAQDRPELYDGYLIAAPAIEQEKFGLAKLYVQVVMKTDLGFTAADAPKAKAFAAKADAVSARAVAACDAEGLGFLVDPFACAYNPARDAAALCTGAVGDGVTGRNADTALCVSRPEADAINKIWYGPTRDGSFDPDQTADARSGRTLAPKQLWWANTRGSSVAGLITSPGTDLLALMRQDASQASSQRFSYTSAAGRFVNGSTAQRDGWMQLDYAGLVDVFGRIEPMQPALGDLLTNRADLRALRDLGRKVIVHHGLGEDVIPPAGMVSYHTRVAAAMGGEAEVRQFMRLHLEPAVAHSSQGRTYTVGNRNNNSVPLPSLPGNANQTPTPEQDPMFSALVDWVERGVAPGNITVSSRDKTVSYPLCVFPQKITWDKRGSAKLADSYSCQ